MVSGGSPAKIITFPSWMSLVALNEVLSGWCGNGFTCFIYESLVLMLLV